MKRTLIVLGVASVATIGIFVASRGLPGDASDIAANAFSGRLTVHQIAMRAQEAASGVAKASFEERQHVIAVPVEASVPVQPRPLQPDYAWVVSSDQTRTMTPGAIVAWGPIHPGKSPRIELISTSPINVGFLPSDWQQQILSQAGTLDANWKTALCLQRGVLHITVECDIDSAHDQSLFIQDARHVLNGGDVLGAALMKRVAGINPTVPDQSATPLQMKVLAYSCVKNCDQQH